MIIKCKRLKQKSLGALQTNIEIQQLYQTYMQYDYNIQVNKAEMLETKEIYNKTICLKIQE